MRFINPTHSMYAGTSPAPSCPSCGSEGCCAPGMCIMGGQAPCTMPTGAGVPAWAQPNPAPAGAGLSGCTQCGDIPCCPPNVCKPYYPPNTGEVFWHCMPPVPKVGTYSSGAQSPAKAMVQALGRIPGAGVVRGVSSHAMGAVRTLGSNPASVADRDEMCCVC